jgi:enterochelin esterase family protein
VYLPPGYAEGTARYPVLYLHDGEDELAFGAIDAILDELIARRAIPPVMAVLVPPLRRDSEYGRNPAFEAFFLAEVVPAVDARYRTVAAPAGRIVGGASWGALAALSLGLGHPDVFGGVLLHSGAYGVHFPALVALARGAGPRAPAVWIDVGAFEEDMNGHDLLAENRRLREALTAAGVRMRYLEVPEGHSWGSWRARKREALEFLLGAMAGPALP